MSHVACRKCGSRIRLAVRLRSLAPVMFTTTCPSCGFRGVYSYVDIVEEGVYRAKCMTCGVHLYSFRLGRVRCPVCGSRYQVGEGGWQLLERGEPKPGPAQTLAITGMLEGGIAGASKGRDAPGRIASMVSGSIAGLVIGSLLGSLLELMFGTEREVIYE